MAERLCVDRVAPHGVQKHADRRSGMAARGCLGPWISIWQWRLKGVTMPSHPDNTFVVRCFLCSFSCKPESLSLHHLAMVKHAIDPLHSGMYTTVHTGGSPFRILSVSVWVELSTHQCNWHVWTGSGLTYWVLKRIN